MIPDRRISFLLVVSLVLVVAMIVSTVLPFRRGRRVAANEDAAVATLTALLAGGGERRPVLRFVPDLAAEHDFGDRFGGDVRDGDLRHRGYRFRVYLPDAEGHGVRYRDRERVDVGRAARFGACYAWPEVYGETGRRAFLLTLQGTLLVSENEQRKYDGGENAPRPGAGFRARDPERIIDPLAPPEGDYRGRGSDGQVWAYLATDG